MNEPHRLKLMAAAGAEQPPAVPEDFAGRVLRQVRRDVQAPAAPTLWDQLELLFPRLACAALVLILACVGGDYALNTWNPADLADTTAQIAGQWLLNPNGI